MVIKMKNNKIKTSFGSIEGRTARSNKTGIEFGDLYFNRLGKLSVN